MHHTRLPVTGQAKASCKATARHGAAHPGELTEAPVRLPQVRDRRGVDVEGAVRGGPQSIDPGGAAEVRKRLVDLRDARHVGDD